MNTEPHTAPAAPPKSKRPLLIMLLVSVLPVAGAYFVYFTGIGMPDTTVNAGAFIQPAVSIETLVGETQWQQRIQADKKWRLLVPIASPCDELCAQNLYVSRQVHIRLDQRSKRLERLAVALNDIDDAELAKIKADHPKLVFIHTPSARVAEWFAQIDTASQQGAYLLVDQEGKAMMSYTSEIHGNDVLKDIKRALKYSIDYQ